jgi:PadR family transcriptional regulator PadR
MELKNMIKRVRELDSKALMASSKFRDYVEKQETEINRGLSSLCILSIIIQAGEEGSHGYQILKDLTNQTNDMLVIVEGTLYPILRKLESDGIIESKKEETGRKRKFYPLFDVKVNLKQDKYLFCPMCANKIDLSNEELRFCDICGHNIEKELNTRGLKNE